MKDIQYKTLLTSMAFLVGDERGSWLHLQLRQSLVQLNRFAVVDQIQACSEVRSEFRTFCCSFSMVSVLLTITGIFMPFEPLKIHTEKQFGAGELNSESWTRREVWVVCFIGSWKVSLGSSLTHCQSPDASFWGWRYWVWKRARTSWVRHLITIKQTLND